MFQQPQNRPTTQRPGVFTRNSVILFQGDSITDGNRGRNNDPNHILGHGYAFIVAAKIGDELADQNITFINRGISANTVADLATRWDADALQLQPDVISILVGINDAAKGVATEDFEKRYDELLQRTREVLPEVKFVLIEPFFLPVGTRLGDAAFGKTVEARRAIVTRLAKRHRARLVHAQAAFDRACERAPASYWIWDGIHPTYSGHQVLANAWLEGVERDPITN